MLPKISIIIATYNSAAFLERALRSVKNQIFKGWECIMIDGCSTDDTVDIFKKFAGNDERFSYISEKDRGVYDAFNKGWQKAKGEWIYYLGSDDELLPNGLNVLLNISSGADIVCGSTIMRRLDGSTKLKGLVPVDKAMPYSFGATHQAIIMKRELIKKLGGFDLKYKIIADFDLLSRVFRAHVIIHETYAPIAYFQIGGLSADNFGILSEKYSILLDSGVSKLHAIYYVCRMVPFFIALKIKHKLFH